MAESDALTQLFSVAPDEFVATRDRLAAELARGGHKDESRELKKLRRPSPTAWATNQVVRRARAAVDGFLAASDELRARQGALLAGRGDQTSYQAGVEGLREATAALAASAREVLAAAGRGGERELVDGVVANLRIAALAEDGRRALLEARLTADLEAVDDALAGLGLAGAVFTPSSGAAAAARAPAAAVGGSDEKAREKQRREEREQREDAEKARALTEARRAEAEARELAARAEATARDATAQREQARADLDEAERAVATAREALREAEAAQRQAAKDQASADGQARMAARRLETLERG